MEGVGRGLEPLDYVAFKFEPTTKRYELFICRQGESRRMSVASLEQVVFQLPCVKDHFDQSREIFKLQPVGSPRSAQWFKEQTLDRFVAIVGSAELLEHAIKIESELSQLEQARRFHLALYSEGDRDGSLIYEDGNHLKESTIEDKSTVSAGSGDTTKNELLRAMDVRLAALREELRSTLDRAAGGSCSFQELTDLLEFTQNFGSENLKNLFLKYFALSQHSQSADDSGEKHFISSHMHATYENDNTMGVMQVPTITDSASNAINEENCSANTASPDKIAQAERQISTDSEESSECSDGGRHQAERSRTMIRSASPRRSASPMRRVQIGRSGSRRATALTIKSLGFFPTRERITVNREHENNSEDEEATEMPKKTESLGRKFSVQDAIHLFESRQKDSSLDFQTRRVSSETGASFINANKSVLRRWSAGVQSTSTDCIQENGSEGTPQKVAKSSVENTEDVKSETIHPTIPEMSPQLGSSAIDNARDTFDKGEKGSAKGEAAEIDEIKDDGTSEHELTATEWNKQKEAELNQMLLKMIQSKPVKSQNHVGNGPNQVKKDLSSEKKEGLSFSDQYKEKRNARIQGEIATKRAEKDAKSKILQADLQSRKVSVATKPGRANVKQDSSQSPKNLARNSSPLGMPMHEVSKPSASRKASPRPSPMSTTRSSLSSAASTRTSITPVKASTPTSSSSATSRKKNQPPASPVKRIAEAESSQNELLQKTKRVSPSAVNTNLKRKDEKQQIVTKKNSSGSCGTRIDDVTHADGSQKSPAKPTLYKATKKSSVVPLESKPFLRKGRGTRTGANTVAKTKGAQLDDSLKTETGVTQSAVMEASTVLMDTPQSEHSEMDQAKPDELESEQGENVPMKREDATLEAHVESPAPPHSRVNGCIKTQTTFSAQIPNYLNRVSASEDVTDLIWVEMDQQEKPSVDEIPPLKTSITPLVPQLPARSPRVRHSLSQMLQADVGEPEIVTEWGNAENPPALVYQKESPKGFKRLLKFGRKSRGGDNLAPGWSGSQAVSEGEDDDEESKGVSNINRDTLLRKSAPHMKAVGQRKAMPGESYEVSNSNRRSMEYNTNPELLAKRSSLYNVAHSSPKLRQDQVSATGGSTKGKSFFSLSTFRSKGNETKLR